MPRIRLADLRSQSILLVKSTHLVRHTRLGGSTYISIPSRGPLILLLIRLNLKYKVFASYGIIKIYFLSFFFYICVALVLNCFVYATSTIRRQSVDREIILLETVLVVLCMKSILRLMMTCPQRTSQYVSLINVVLETKPKRDKVRVILLVIWYMFGLT